MQLKTDLTKMQFFRNNLLFVCKAFYDFMHVFLCICASSTFINVYLLVQLLQCEMVESVLMLTYQLIAIAHYAYDTVPIKVDSSLCLRYCSYPG